MERKTRFEQAKPLKIPLKNHYKIGDYEILSTSEHIKWNINIIVCLQVQSNRNQIWWWCFCGVFLNCFCTFSTLKACSPWGFYKDPSHFYWGSILTLLHSRITRGDFFKLMLHQEKEKINHRLGGNICKRHIW